VRNIVIFKIVQKDVSLSFLVNEFSVTNLLIPGSDFQHLRLGACFHGY
jgi:hypothetical protein